MGVNICLRKMPEEKEVPFSEWDFTRWAGDREFSKLMFEWGVVAYKPVEAWTDDEWLYRPSNFQKWRESIDELEGWQNSGRLKKLTDLLEAHPDYWININW